MDHARIVVSTEMLAELIDDWVAKTNLRLTDGGSDDEGGAATILANRMMTYGFEEEASLRRTYGIRTRDTLSTEVRIADPMLLCIDTTLWEAKIPVFPDTVSGARAMVDAYLAESGERMSLPEREQLVEKLRGFGKGFLTAYDEPNHEARKEMSKRESARRKRVAARHAAARAELAGSAA